MRLDTFRIIRSHLVVWHGEDVIGCFGWYEGRWRTKPRAIMPVDEGFYIVQSGITDGILLAPCADNGHEELSWSGDR